MATTYTRFVKFRKTDDPTKDQAWGDNYNANIDILESADPISHLASRTAHPSAPSLYVKTAAGDFVNRAGKLVPASAITSRAISARPGLTPPDTTQDNYIYLDESGTIASSISSFPGVAATPHIRLTKFSADSTKPKSYEDYRSRFFILGPVPFLAYVDWSSPVTISSTIVEVDGQIRWESTDQISDQIILRIFLVDSEFANGASTAATISAKATPLGTILAGSGTAEVKVQTNSSGQFGIRITSTAAGQFGRPASDVTVGGWTATPLFEKLDETSPDDATTQISRFFSTPPLTVDFEVKLSSVTDPNTSSGHTVRYRMRIDGGTFTAVAKLVQGGTVVSTDPTTRALSTSYTTYEWTLTGTEADSITDYSDLRVRVTTSFSGGLNNSAFCTWIEMETPGIATSVWAHERMDFGTRYHLREFETLKIF